MKQKFRGFQTAYIAVLPLRSAHTSPRLSYNVFVVALDQLDMYLARMEWSKINGFDIWTEHLCFGIDSA